MHHGYRSATDYDWFASLAYQQRHQGSLPGVYECKPTELPSSLELTNGWLHLNTSPHHSTHSCVSQEQPISGEYPDFTIYWAGLHISLRFSFSQGGPGYEAHNVITIIRILSLISFWHVWPIPSNMSGVVFLLWGDDVVWIWSTSFLLSSVK